MAPDNPIVQSILIMSQQEQARKEKYDRMIGEGNPTYFYEDTSMLFAVLNSIAQEFKLKPICANFYDYPPSQHPNKIWAFLEELNQSRPILKRFGILVEMQEVIPPTLEKEEFHQPNPNRKRIMNSIVAIKKYIP